MAIITGMHTTGIIDTAIIVIIVITVIIIITEDLYITGKLKAFNCKLRLNKKPPGNFQEVLIFLPVYKRKHNAVFFMRWALKQCSAF
jgi:hypothetical protein